MITEYLVDIIILLLAAVVIVPLFQTMRLGAVPGFLIAGTIVGPYGLGLISNFEQIGHFAEIGVVFLLFIIGIELKPTRLWQMRRLVFGLGSLQILLTGLAIGLIAHFAFGIGPRASILIGPALALSSTAFVLQILSERNLLRTTYGRTSLAILLMQDLAVVPLLILVSLLVVPELSIGTDILIALGESLLILLLVIFAGRYFLHPILHRVALSRNPEVFTASAVLIVIGTALLTEHAGLSMAMGAFLAGLLISDSFYRHQIIAEIQPFRGILLGMFFISMGMSLNINLLFDKPLESFSLLLLLVSIKALILFPLALLYKMQSRNSKAIALLLAQSGEFALVLFSLANQSKLLTDDLFQQLLVIVLLSMLITPVLSQWAYIIINKQKARRDKESIPINEAPIVIAGFGRVGHRIGEILTQAGKPFVGLDMNPEVVEIERLKGHQIFYGDVRNPEVLKSAGINQAGIIIITINDPHATQEILVSLRKTYPDMHIYARGQSLLDCQALRRIGATGVVSENIEASLELSRMVLQDSGVDDQQLQGLINNFRTDYQNQINDEP